MKAVDVNIKDIAATLAILGSGTLVIGCGKGVSDVPGGSEAAPSDGADPHQEEGNCSAEVTDPDPADPDPDVDADVTDPDPG